VLLLLLALSVVAFVWAQVPAAQHAYRAHRVASLAGCLAVEYDTEAERLLGFVPRAVRLTASDTTLTVGPEPQADSALFFWEAHVYRRVVPSADLNSLELGFGHGYGGTQLELHRQTSARWYGEASSSGDTDAPPCRRPVAAHPIACGSLAPPPALDTLRYRDAVLRLEGVCAPG
jgi:hypothetical protein